jgi:hypothetical protein
MRRDDHPIAFVRTLRARFGDDLILSFSRYRYIRRSREDHRQSFVVPIRDVNQRWLAGELCKLHPDEELALESRVRIRQVIRHIPMLDFVSFKPEELAAVTNVLPQYKIREAFIYSSGRSFHAYFPLLITATEWVRFMGSALLCNTPSNPRVIDQRWVGHRLIGGFGALRWSWNTSAYRTQPKRVRSIKPHQQID